MLSIKWRPSGGRGEYEYKVTGAEVLGRRLDVKVPHLDVEIKTDVHFRIRDGKHRLRRDNPNDRSVLNVPPLVTAIAGLPEPRRQNMGTEVTFPLSDKSYVVDEILFEIVKSDPESVVVKPILLKPRNSSAYIDIESRIADLVASESSVPSVSHLLGLIRAGINEASTLTPAALAVHNDLPYLAESSTDQAPNSPPVVDEPDEIVEEYVGNEGKEKIRIHRHKERDKKLVKLAKKKFKLTYGKLFCECCGVDFEQMYSTLGVDFIEAHHRIPLAQVANEVKTSITDLAMLCSNCHRMVHRTQSCSVQEVRGLIAANNSFANAGNIALIEAATD